MKSHSKAAHEIVGLLELKLREAGTPERAEKEKAYLKSNLEFYGVTVPAIRKIVRTMLNEHVGLDRSDVLVIVKLLWTNKVHELRKAAVEILEHNGKLLNLADLPLLERLIRESTK